MIYMYEILDYKIYYLLKKKKKSKNYQTKIFIF